MVNMSAIPSPNTSMFNLYHLLVTPIIILYDRVIEKQEICGKRKGIRNALCSC